MTRVALTIIDILLAHVARKTAATLAFVIAGRSHETDTTILAGIRITVVYMKFTDASAVTARAVTLESFRGVATAAMATGFVQTSDYFLLAQWAAPILQTLTFVTAI